MNLAYPNHPVYFYRYDWCYELDDLLTAIQDISKHELVACNLKLIAYRLQLTPNISTVRSAKAKAEKQERTM